MVTRVGIDHVGEPAGRSRVAEAGPCSTNPNNARVGDPNVCLLEPDGCVAEAVGRAPRRGVKLALRGFRFGQTQKYKNGAVESLHFFGGQ